MKKLLLLSVAVVISAAAIAQTAPKLKPRVDAKRLSVMSSDNLTQNVNTIPRVTAKRVLPSGNHTTAFPIIVTDLGQSANAFGNFYIGKSLLQYEPAINTVTLMHRNNPAVTGDPNTGYYRFDKSTDAGVTWTSELGPIYGPLYNSGNTYTGRYPVGTIGNPVGNTDPDNAYEAYSGVWHDGVVWHGELWGAGRLNNSSTTEHYDSTNASSGNMTWVEDIFATKTNETWKMGAVELDNAGTYADSLRVDHGIWNGSDYVYTNQNLYFHANSILALRPYDMNIAFSDDGMTGYAVCINNGDEGNLNYPTGVMYLQMYITTDGGVTWSGGGVTPTDVDVQYTVGGPLFGNVDSTFTVTGWGACRPDFDMVVDGNGNLHVIIGVFPGSNFGESNTTPGTWGICDLYTTDAGTTWYAELLAMPNTYLGNFGDATNIQEGNRPFASRSADGTKLFFGWYDTSPDFGTPLNDFPDLMVKGYDLTTHLWTAVKNMTTGGTDAEGACTFGLGSYYAIENSCTFTIPAAYMLMTVDINGACQFKYIDGATMTCTDFVNPGNPVLIKPTGINEIPTAVNHFSVSSNYPNPFNGKTYLDITLSSATDVTIEVSNMIGQVMSTVHHNLNAGENKRVAIDGSSLAKGVYVYKVIAGSEVVTRTMTVR